MKAIALAGILSFVGAWGCMGEEGDGALRVAALGTVLADFAREIGGERVEVVEIIPADVNPHFYEPSPADIREVAGADLILANGLGFEPYLENLRDAIGKGPQVFVAGDFIKNPIHTEGGHCAGGHDHEHGHDHGGFDPHWWHGIEEARLVARALRDAMTSSSPSDAALFEANEKELQSRLDDLQKWVKGRVAELPLQRRVLVTTHDALAYFGREFRFRIVPVAGVSPSEQPSSQKVRDIIELIRREGVGAIFPEMTENPRVLQEITRETGVKTGTTLFADGLGKNEAATYEEMMRHNVNAIVDALK